MTKLTENGLASLTAMGIVGEAATPQKLIEKTAENLCRNEVLACVTSLIEGVISMANHLDSEVVEDVCPFDPMAIEEARLRAMEAEGLDYEDDCLDIYEYWIVGAHLADDLEEVGAVIFETNDGTKIWGRTTTGQAISLDAVFQAAAERLLVRTDDLE